ncbi:uncharacterized protein DEA37_0011372 [Paragonimus westermani]|uniref:Hemicentin-1-like von Willebrand factor A domain-containing protein n=1 Tax=Paragonimus westermani TaxID=34504 RepID=A0A5J4NHA3_9TREM|nr:uncharacterized protein DEA37_0011372 [Paragonimus westermani]
MSEETTLPKPWVIVRMRIPLRCILLLLLQIYALTGNVGVTGNSPGQLRLPANSVSEDSLMFSPLASVDDQEINITLPNGEDLTASSAISLAIVFDSTGSMGNDLKQVKIGARRILQRHMQRGEANYIKDFVLVKVHDPGEYICFLANSSMLNSAEVNLPCLCFAVISRARKLKTHQEYALPPADASTYLSCPRRHQYNYS